MRKDNSILKGPSCQEKGEGEQRTRWIDGVKEIMGKSMKELATESFDRQEWRKSVHEVTRSQTRLEG